MTTPRFIWNLTKTKCIKTKEIRELNVTWNADAEAFDVIAFGFFGGGVTLFTSKTQEECRGYINDLIGLKQKVKEQTFGEDTSTNVDFQQEGMNERNDHSDGEGNCS